ncbi:TPA: KpsF/GutQ family sugar-phosphate isomerase [Serratia marcescens]|jgi:arabinose-5-phosphate isomerase|uniref:KpsF/GutQ family sugar-phosphate isomerase n=1 Tax=Serratia TaxID=613 RepID=UPI0018D79737|nr:MULTISPECIES: KpsF/GutQ family sugar-phosphate isomerase [Serratia]EIV2912819.1 KpsF/GutQ family sugar-phosphate isomerase [Serratia marcescens]MBH2749102.1 KpsF/GutQ family sugar-phosphate isomerase [Serratia marcescens]MBH2969773.1 KpsF/GutQ family sugar-phosphate isomerase [Serratia marcescens]MBH3260438.1 KpsF/GutQ family sugar-phosphate isomerase [Serratia marcescens]MBN6137702.1 KpsF/GutQ family sugar-phosphate isomerase [Serratia marcescens]
MKAIEVAKKVINTEIRGLESVLELLDENFSDSVELILQSTGRVIISGMGKSGLIGRKIAASLASTGTPSFYMHPGEAFHGDLGMIKEEDIFIAISNSGETDEMLKLLPFLEDNKNKIISITGSEQSTLARSADYHLNVWVPEEACPHQLAPTSSTTAALVMGDALTIALMELRNFRPENFARFHPGGSLGRKLLRKVRDEMVSSNLPIIDLSSSIIDAIKAISSGNLGLVIVCDAKKLFGIITDGDLRRALDKHSKEIFDLRVLDIVKTKPHTISQNISISKAYDKMESLNITSLIVTDNEEILGVLKK